MSILLDSFSMTKTSVPYVPTQKDTNSHTQQHTHGRGLTWFENLAKKTTITDKKEGKKMGHTAGLWGRWSIYPAVRGGGRCWYCCCRSPKNPNPSPPNNPPPAVWPKKLPSGWVKNGSLKKGSLSNTSKILLPRPDPPPPMPNPMPKLANGSGNPPNRPAPSRRLPRPPDAIPSLNLGKIGQIWATDERLPSAYTRRAMVWPPAVHYGLDYHRSCDQGCNNLGFANRERGKREKRERAKEDEAGRRLGLKPRGSHVVVSCSPLLPP